ncbi:MAG: spore protease YyaC [Clostridiales bacterium]|jgi:putative sporulation protein YyaC|nr:spore protease YyaC [Clostridiales bacterium]
MLGELSGESYYTRIDSRSENAKKAFLSAFDELTGHAADREIVLFCIGSDRATGDCFGPLIGYKLQNSLKAIDNAYVYGTLDAPVHAKNIARAIKKIFAIHREPFIIAIDASLGSIEHIGYITVGKGPVSPGSGLDKRLPKVGDVFVTGVVNYNYSMDTLVLQNTRLSLVMKMADIVSEGILETLAPTVMST